MFKRKLLAGVAACALMAGAVACSSGGGAASEPSAAEGGTGGTVSTPRYTFALISHAPAGDAFFDVIQKGANDAAAKDNVELKYSGSGQIPEQAQMIQNAIDSKVDGIAVSMPDPDALAPAIQTAVDAGIPVIIYNAGDRDWQKSGGLAFFGEPEVLAGEYAGTELNELGATNALCVLQAQGQVQLEDRCAGLDATFNGTTEKLYAEGTDAAAYTSTVHAKLQSDPSIDAVVTLGPALGVAIANDVKASGGDQQVVTYAFNSDVIPLLQDGSIAFTIDQQPWLQGYMSIDALWQYKYNNSVLGADQSIPTGPVVVDKSNIDTIVPFIEQDLR